MKRATILLALAALLLLAAVVQGQAQSPASTSAGYDLTWWTVDGGGVVSSAGGYSLSATAGQPDAAVWAGNGYTLAGGFRGGGALMAYQVYLPLVLRGF